MKKIAIITALFALSFATGFTCSKNAPEQATTTTTTETVAPAAPPADPSQAQMAAPASADMAPATATPTETK